MIESQTFSIMREPEAVLGARRITDPKLRVLFERAAKRSGVPVSLLEAIAYLESWGDPKAVSPAGPKGIMQFSQGTARVAGLRIVRARRYRTVRQRVAVRRKGKTTYRTVVRRRPYTVVIRDDRLVPSRAIPAAANYLAGLDQKFGGLDWAVFAYHCGEGCTAEMQSLTARASGVPIGGASVPRMFFSSSPVWNRELHAAVERHMARDYSPTYWFRVKRAEQLLALYRRDARAFAALAEQYKSEINGGTRAPHRLSVWLTKQDLLFQTCDDLRADEGRRLAKALERPKYFGYSLRPTIGADDPDNRSYYLMASPAAIGTLTYIAFETRRLHQVLKPRGEKFEPLEVTALVHPADRAGSHPEAMSHCSGQVFDLNYTGLPPGQRECLRFVLNDLGWDGYLGFVEEGPANLHIGCSPNSREFFATVFDEAMKAAD
jgi:hypothetical protein